MTASAPPTTLRRLDSPAARTLVELLATFDELQTTLRCCERLVTELAAVEVDEVVVEALWTTALLGYARGFAEPASLSFDDVRASVSHEQAGQWHEVLLRLREHYAHPTANPRERFSVGVAQDGDGAAAGIGVSSTRQPLVDEVTVRQCGAVAYALSSLVDQRIGEQQAVVFAEVQAVGAEELDRLPVIEVAGPSSG